MSDDVLISVLEDLLQEKRVQNEILRDINNNLWNIRGML